MATHLARVGRRVLLLERAFFPREHIGESLLPGVLPYLDALGVREAIEHAGFERKEGQTFIWGRDRTPWELDFRELDVHPYAFFVERAKFDHILLRHAEHCGATVREGCTVTRVHFENGRAVGVDYRDPQGVLVTERTRFVVDASGASALIARNTDLLRPVRGLKNIAFWSYWENAERLPGHRRHHILTVSIPEGWIWVIPLATRTSVGVVTSSAAIRTERERLGTTEWYQRTLQACPPVWELLRHARRIAPVTGAQDWSYRARRTSGPGILLAGDAACFIDPILSTGVHLAMSAGYWAAACVHSSLERPQHEAFFRRFYDETYAATYRELLTQVKAFYKTEVRRDSIYWTSKKVLRLGNAVAPELAFLFITSGLLRNAATTAPHNPIAQISKELRSRVEIPESLRTSHEPLATRTVSPPLVWRTGPQGNAQLVTVRAEGLRLRLQPHEPRGLTDRPQGTWFAFDLEDPQHQPLALVLVEERRRPHGLPSPTVQGRLCFTLHPYDHRPHDPKLIEAIHRAVSSTLSNIDRDIDEPSSPLSLRTVRTRLKRTLSTALPDGIHLVPSRQLRGGNTGEPALTTVFEATIEEILGERVYFILEARVPPELREIPPLRTRFVDLWIRPERTRQGQPLRNVPTISRFLDTVCIRLRESLLHAATRTAAFHRAQHMFETSDWTTTGFRLVACGRLEAPSTVTLSTSVPTEPAH